MRSNSLADCSPAYIIEFLQVISFMHLSLWPANATDSCNGHHQRQLLPPLPLPYHLLSFEYNFILVERWPAAARLERKSRVEREGEQRVNLNQIFWHGASIEMKSISFVRHLKGFKWFSIVACHRLLPAAPSSSLVACCLLLVGRCLVARHWQSVEASYILYRLGPSHIKLIIRFRC